MFLQTVVEVIY